MLDSLMTLPCWSLNCSPLIGTPDTGDAAWACTMGSASLRAAFGLTFVLSENRLLSFDVSLRLIFGRDSEDRSLRNENVRRSRPGDAEASGL